LPQDRINYLETGEMSKELNAQVTDLGRALEGEGKIKSTLPESEYESFGEALQKSIVEIEEPECAACIDGRCVQCQMDQSPRNIRPRVAGASLAPFAMLAMGDRLYLEGLADGTKGSEPEAIYEQIEDLQKFLGNREGGHNDCGAAKGFTKHVKTAHDFDPQGPSLTLVKQVVHGEFPNEDTEDMALAAKKNAGMLTDVLEGIGWDGLEYTDRIAANSPDTFEVLEVKDDEVGGHAEDAVVIVDGPVDNNGRPIHTVDEEALFKLTGRRAFIVNLAEMRRDADMLGSTVRQKAQLMTSGLMHLAGAFKNLGDGSQPVYLVQINQ
jgi:hypothetical protein